MTVDELIEKINTDPESINFTEVINTIEKNYHYTPTRFHNGTGKQAASNEAGTNEGSCKIFAFATLHGLNEEETLACFGKYYREDVLNNPEGNDHENIRTFIRHGWSGIQFEGTVLI